MSCRVLLLLCAALAVSAAANPRQLDAVRHFLQRHHRQAAVPAPHVLRTFTEPKQQQPKEQEQLAPQEPKEQLAPQEPKKQEQEQPAPHVLRTFIEPKQQEPEQPAPQEPKEPLAQQEMKEQEPLAPQEPTPTPSPWFDCPAQFGLYPDPYDCSYYFQCNGGFAFEQHCQPGLQFNPATSTCDWPVNINPPCQAIPYPTAAGPQPAAKQQQSREQRKSQKDALQEPTPTPSPWFDCTAQFGLYPDPYDCTSYFQCSYGIAFEEKCGSGLQFNPVTSTCDWPANIDPPCQAIPYPTAEAPALQ